MKRSEPAKNGQIGKITGDQRSRLCVFVTWNLVKVESSREGSSNIDRALNHPIGKFMIVAAGFNTL